MKNVKKLFAVLTALVLVVTFAVMGVSAAGRGTGYTDAGLGDGGNRINCTNADICGRFEDTDGDGVCDYRENCANSGTCGHFSDTDGDGVCDQRGAGFTDTDGDGVCDYRSSGNCGNRGTCRRGLCK